jgi:hypothetical protein
MKKQDWKSAPRDKQRIVISLIGWIIDLIITAVRKKREKSPETAQD